MRTSARVRVLLAFTVWCFDPLELCAQTPPQYVFQATGPGGVNVNNSAGARIYIEHTTQVVVHSDELYLAKALKESYDAYRLEVHTDAKNLERLAQRVTRVSAQIAKLARERAVDSEDTRRDQDELRKQLEHIQSNYKEFFAYVLSRMLKLDELEERVDAHEDRLDAHEGRLDALERSRRTKELNEALDDADLERAIKLYNYMDFERGKRSLSDGHIGLSMVGDTQPFKGGVVGYFRLATPEIAYVRRLFAVGLAGGASMSIGAASIRGDRSFFFDVAVNGGPWLRLGGATNLMFEVYAVAPLYMYVGGHSTYPLLGLGGRVGLSLEPFSLGVFYRRSFNSILGDDPDVASVGIDFSFVSSDSGGISLLGIANREYRSWRPMLGLLSNRSFPDGGLVVGVGSCYNTTYYPTSSGVGVGVAGVGMVTAGQLKRSDDAAFLTSLGFSWGLHAQFGAHSFGYLKVEVQALMDLVAYSDSDWKFFLPGLGGEVTLLGSITFTYKHVHASWRDDALGDYNLLMIGINRPIRWERGDNRRVTPGDVSSSH